MKKSPLLIVLSLSLLLCGCVVNSLRAEDLIAPGGQVAKLADGFIFTEGPARDAEGNVYFSDVRSNRIHIWTTGGKLKTFRENSGAANGLYFDKQGNLLVCEGGNRRVTRISPDGEKFEVLADSFDGKKLNSPNDLWPDPQGGIYFTDPRYGSEEGLEQDGFHVYYIPPGGGEIRRVIDNLKKPNGVKGTADGKLLYVADPGDKKTYLYDIQKDGSLANRRLIAEQGSDGMTLDERGNLYLTGAGVSIYNAKGEKFLEIGVPERPANVTFGGKDNKTLFITARTGLYAVPMKVEGQ
jgi:gluconolactonase